MRKRFLWLFVLAPLGLLLGGCSGGGTHDIEKLLADLTSDSARARSRAERTLAEHGRSVIKPLSSILTLKDVEKTVKDYSLKKDPKTLRLGAARALGVIAARASLARSEAETAAAPLLEVLNKKEAPELRVEAAKALGFFTQLSAPANDLILTFREDDPALVEAATESLARNALRSVYFLAPPQEPPASAAEKDWARLLERIHSTDDDIRLDTVRELAASRDPRAAALLLERVVQDKGRDVRYAALGQCIRLAASGSAPQGFAEKLDEQLPASFAKDDDSRVLLLAARLLRERKPELVGAFLTRVAAATEKVETRLFHDATNSEADTASRADAIDALVLLPSARRDELLAKLLDSAARERARIKRAAAGVLATSDSQTAFDALQKAMGDDDSVVKLVAAQALGRRGNLEAVKYLVALLDDEEAAIRADAADGLGTLGAKAVPVLIEQLTSALQELKGKPGQRNAKYKAWGIVTGLGRIAEQIGPEAAPALDAVVEAADCGDEDVRRVAAVALGFFQGEKAIAALARRLKDLDESVQWHALVALERHGGAALPTLVAALQEEAISGFVAAALGRIGDGETLKPLLDRLAAAKGAGQVDLLWGIGELLRRYPSSPNAAAAKKALEAASPPGDDSEAARTARYALMQAGAKGE